MNLIIEASLIDPPSESLYVRYVTLVTKSELNLSNLIQVEQKVKDFYFHFMKEKGILDFVDQFITKEENEFGIRISPELNYPLTIKTQAITCENCINILGQIKMLKKLVPHVGNAPTS
jgi:hypothetical protein